MAKAFPSDNPFLPGSFGPVTPAAAASPLQITVPLPTGPLGHPSPPGPTPQLPPRRPSPWLATPRNHTPDSHPPRLP